MNRDNQEWMKKTLAVLAVLIIAVLVCHIVSVVSFNQHEYVVQGADDASTSYLSINNREDSTSTWVKRDFDLYGKTVDLLAQTFDATLYNRSSYEISEWMLRIDIKDDCFINNAWCGTMEIHQYTGTDKEQVQTLDLRAYDRKEVKLDYLYDGDLLIPLVKGDYLIYYPSLKDSEFPIKGNSELTMGMIFYYEDTIDLSGYEITYRYHEKFTDGWGFYAVIVLLVLWSIGFTAQAVSSVSYKRAWQEMENRKSGISYMSDIYENIYIIDLENDEMTPLHSATESERIMMRNAGAREHLLNMLEQDATEPYKRHIRKFADLKTLDKRLDKKSIACEYQSNANGWCQARFFSMDREPGKPLVRTIFTIQIINEEKLEMERIEESMQESLPVEALKAAKSEYSFPKLANNIETYASNAVSGTAIAFESDISPKVPKLLYGEPDRIRRVTEFLISNLLYHRKEGTVKLSVFAKTTGDQVHLLVSVKGMGGGDSFDENAPGYGLAEELLAAMDSELHLLKEAGGLEAYYEIEQKISGDAGNGE